MSAEIFLLLGEAGGEFVDSGTVTLSLQASGTETKTQFDSEIVLLDLQPSGTDTQQSSTQYTDSGTALLKLTPTGAEPYHFTAYKNGNSFTNDTTIGDRLWDTPGNAQSSDDFHSSSEPSLPPGITNYLKVLNFSPAIPTQATIKGIVFEVEKRAQATFTPVADYAVRIVKGGVIGSENKANRAEWSDLSSYVAYGNPDDLWGETLTPADVNATNFGIVFAAEAFATNALAHIDHIRLKVYYTLQTTEVQTVTIKLTPSGSETTQAVDSSIIPLALTASATFTRQIFDAATASLTFTPSAIERSQFRDVPPPVGLLFTPSGSDTYTSGSNVDAGTALLKFTPLTTTEIRFLYDTLLVGALSRNWVGVIEPRRVISVATRKWSGTLRDQRWFGAMPLRKWMGSASTHWTAMFGRGI